MGVEQRPGDRRKGEESGQSILEFLLMLPVLITLTVLLIKINMTIQVSIVNQQYARAQALFLTFNSPVYVFEDPFRRLGLWMI